MTFFIGLHQPSDCRRFAHAFVSVNRLRDRKSDFRVRDWILDSGAFSELARFGRYRDGVARYAEQIHRWQRCGHLLAAVSQDYMCEPAMLTKTGLSVPAHQRLTIERYRALRRLVRGTYVMPVLQGYAPADYVRHLRAYGRLLPRGAWVGVGSVCKRNADVDAIRAVLRAVRCARADLRLHGFGLKTTALDDAPIRASSTPRTPWRGASMRAATAGIRTTGARPAGSCDASPSPPLHDVLLRLLRCRRL